MKEMFFKFVTGIAVFAFILSACSLNSASWLPTYICGISLLWLTYATYKSEQKQAEESEED